MLKHFYIVLISTLLFGFCTGMYVFFISRTPAEPVFEVDTSTNGFEIIANRYGGCERVGCTLYRIFDDGTYTYLSYNSMSEGRRFEDSITDTQRETLELLLEGTDFTEVKEQLFTGTCPITYDGIAYRYDIRFDGVWYSIDSCIEDIEEEALFLELKKYFDIFRLIHENAE